MFGSGKAPATAQRTTIEWLSDPHAIESGLVVEVDDPRHGAMRQMGNLAWLADDAAALDKSPGPAVDELRSDLAGILAESPRPDIEAAVAAGWLEGVQVLDLTNVIAGPTIAATLARFGAEVTSVQPVTPSVDPWNAVVFGLHAHRGKRSALVNLRQPSGRKALDRLLAASDVVTINATDEQREALGLTAERLAVLNPRLIIVQLDAFGGPRRGPKSDHLGYDDLAQAATGVMVRFGGGPDTPEEHAHFGTIDALTGLCACVALGAALERRRLTGRGGIARAALAASGEMIQAQFMYDFNGRPKFDEPAGRDALGWGPFYHCYQAADGWMFLATPTELGAALARVPELADLVGMADADMSRALTARLALHPASHWAERFAGGSTAVVPLGSLAGNRDSSLQRDSDGEVDIRQATYRAVRHDQHAMGRWVDLVAPNAIRPQRAPIRIPGHAPKYGAHTREVLSRVLFTDEEIDGMIAAGAAGERWSDKYLPE